MFWQHGVNPSFEKSPFNNILFILLDRHRGLRNAKHARRFARSRTDASGELREIVGRMQLADGFLPTSAIHEIVPIRNEIVYGTSCLAERDAAIHAART